MLVATIEDLIAGLGTSCFLACASCNFLCCTVSGDGVTLSILYIMMYNKLKFYHISQIYGV